MRGHENCNADATTSITHQTFGASPWDGQNKGGVRFDGTMAKTNGYDCLDDNLFFVLLIRGFNHPFSNLVIMIAHILFVQ